MVSLETLAVLKVTAALWDKNLTSIHVTDKVLQDELIEEVREDLSKLPIPEPLKRKIFLYIEPVGEEIIAWKSFHITRNKLLDGEYCTDDFVWTGDGIIDKAKTAERIIVSKREKIILCYQLACIYCLEYDVQILWEQLTDQEKDQMKTSNCGLVLFWTHVIAKIDMTPLIKNSCFDDPSVNCFGCRIASVMQNEEATKYFFEKLNAEEREREILTSISDIASSANRRIRQRFTMYCSYEYSPRIICFLFLQLTKNQQSRMSPYFILSNFLTYPYINHFMDVLRNFPSLNCFDFHMILNSITGKFYTCNYLFEDFWKRSSYVMKFSSLQAKNLKLIFKYRERSASWLIFQIRSLIDRNFDRLKEGMTPMDCSETDLQLIKLVMSFCCSCMDNACEIENGLLSDIREAFKEYDEIAKAFLEDLFIYLQTF